MKNLEVKEMYRVFDNMDIEVDKIKKMLPSFKNKKEPIYVLGGVLPIYKNAPVIHTGGGVIACITISNETFTPFIAVDDIFDKLSNKTKLFVIYHEIGHFVNGDFFSKKEDFKDILKEKICLKILKVEPPKENQADFYAAYKLDSIPDSLEALDEIHDVLKEHYKERAPQDKLEKIEKNLEKQKTHRKNKLYDLMINGPYYISEEKKEYDFEKEINEAKMDEIEEATEQALNKEIEEGNKKLEDKGLVLTNFERIDDSTMVLEFKED